MSEELVARFFAALESGDIATLCEIYAPALTPLSLASSGPSGARPGLWPD
jgi:ketosteroid isomerase-like protein